MWAVGATPEVPEHDGAPVGWFVRYRAPVMGWLGRVTVEDRQEMRMHLFGDRSATRSGWSSGAQTPPPATSLAERLTDEPR